MSGGGDILGISVSGAVAAQRTLATTGHNIANANTDGFSRQRVDMHARMPQQHGGGAVGTGVVADNIRRVYDGFVVTEMRNTAAVAKSLESEHDYSRQVDDLLADPNASLAPAIQQFFAAVNGVANNPSSSSERQVMLSQAKTLANRFEYIDARFSTLRSTVKAELKNQIVDVNQLAKGIAKINQTINQSRGIGNLPPSDLLDQRDRLIYELSKKMTVRVNEESNGNVNVFVGNGQLLVFGQTAATLDVQNNESDPEDVELVYKGPSVDTVITPYINGGSIGGILDFRNTILNSGQNELGRVAMGVANVFNKQHKLGMDLNGELGGLFFTEADKIAPKAMPNKNNKGELDIAVNITNIDSLTTSDYSLEYYNGTYTMRRLSDDKTIGNFTSLPQDFASEGFRLDAGAGAGIQNGDKYIIRPTRAGARSFGMMTDDVNKIAAASPVRAEASISNLGNGQIKVEAVTDTSGPLFNLEGGELSPPYGVHFTDDNHFEIIDNSGKAIRVTPRSVPDKPIVENDDKKDIESKGHAEGKKGKEESERAGRKRDKDVVAHTDPQPSPEGDRVVTSIEYDKVNGVALFPTENGIDPGIRIKIHGQPKAGDTFRVEFNLNGTGDNSNALEMAHLQDKPTLNNSTANFSEVYSQLVSRVGAKTHELEINHKAQDVLLENAIARREEVSGVNMDEEAANLIRYQNLYQANAQVIAVAKNLFDTLIATFNR